MQVFLGFLLDDQVVLDLLLEVQFVLASQFLQALPQQEVVRHELLVLVPHEVEQRVDELQKPVPPVDQPHDPSVVFVMSQRSKANGIGQLNVRVGHLLGHVGVVQRVQLKGHLDLVHLFVLARHHEVVVAVQVELDLSAVVEVHEGLIHNGGLQLDLSVLVQLHQVRGLLLRDLPVRLQLRHHHPLSLPLRSDQVDLLPVKVADVDLGGRLLQGGAGMD